MCQVEQLVQRPTGPTLSPRECAAGPHQPAFMLLAVDAPALTNAVQFACSALSASTPVFSALRSKDYMYIGAWSSANLGNFHFLSHLNCDSVIQQSVRKLIGI